MIGSGQAIQESGPGRRSLQSEGAVDWGQQEKSSREGNNLTTKGKWKVVSELLKTNERERRNSKDNRNMVSGGRDMQTMGLGQTKVDIQGAIPGLQASQQVPLQIVSLTTDSYSTSYPGREDKFIWTIWNPRTKLQNKMVTQQLHVGF